MPPLVIQTEHLDPAAAAWLAERCRLEYCPSEDPRFAGLLPQADALLIRTYTQVNEALLSKATKLRAVARAGVGLDNVDQEACKKRGIAVLSTPGANTRAVVEYVFALIADALRPRVYLDRPLDAGPWKQARADLIASRQLSDLTLGILGLGRVGSGVARVGVAMDMRVLYNDLLEFPPERRFGATPVSFDELVQRSDILTLHPDGRASNRHLLSAAALARCKADVLIINTSRGFIVDSEALAGFLRERPRAMAMLDVHDPEPFGPDYPLLDLPNCRLAPHLAAATRTAHANMSWVVRDLWDVLSGA